MGGGGCRGGGIGRSRVFGGAGRFPGAFGRGGASSTGGRWSSSLRRGSSRRCRGGRRRWMLALGGAGPRSGGRRRRPRGSTPLRGSEPNMRAGFSPRTRAIHVRRQPALHHAFGVHQRHQRLEARAAERNRLALSSWKMFFQPASFIAFGRGEWSLATAAMGPAPVPPTAPRGPRRRRAAAADRSWPAGPSCCISSSVSSRYCGHVSVQTRCPSAWACLMRSSPSRVERCTT